MKTNSITIKNNNFILYPQKAVFWEEKRILFAADIHLGKASSFRSKGILVPGGSTRTNLSRLSSLLKEIEPEKLLILGDLFHSKNKYSGELVEKLKVWRNEFNNLEIILTSGNHDKNFEKLLSGLNIEHLNDRLEIDQFAFAHHTEEIENKYLFSGHIHPAVKLKEFNRHSVKLPAFYFGKDHAVLPAFGEFTGTYLLNPGQEDEVFVIADNEVLKVT